MIASLFGTVQSIEENGVVLVVNAIGYFVSLPQRDKEQVHIDSEVQLWTHQHVRENAIDLFGFLNRDDRAIFLELTTVSGVGPKMALGIVSDYSAAQISEAIVHQDVAMLQAVSGVGKKTAERIVLELKDSVALFDSGIVAQTASGIADGVDMNAVDALLALGYSRQEVVQALAGVDRELAVEEQVRAALKQLSS